MIEWGATDQYFGMGVERGVLYSGDTAVAWNGLVEIDESEDAGALVEYYYDGTRHLFAQEIPDYKATINAITYPEIFERHDGRTPEAVLDFGLSYRTGGSEDYKLHVVYNALAVPSDRVLSTVQSNLEPADFSWDVYAVPRPMPGLRPTAHLVLHSKGYLDVVREVEDILYGTPTTEARLPGVLEIVEIFDGTALLTVKDNGDGTWTATGPDSIIQQPTNENFVVDSPTAQDYGDIFRLRSL